MANEVVSEVSVRYRLRCLLDYLSDEDQQMVLSNNGGVTLAVKKLLETRGAVSIVNEVFDGLPGREYFAEFVKKFSEPEVHQVLRGMWRILYHTESINALKMAVEIAESYGSERKDYLRVGMVELMWELGEVAKNIARKRIKADSFVAYLQENY